MLAGWALYGLGIPLAWLFPAPSESPWLHRIAIAPLFAIALATVAVFILGRLGIPMHPLQLLGLTVGAWVLAWWRSRGEWKFQESLRAALLPGAMVALGALTWFLSLVGFGLYLPNRDFKNHAYFVAMIASDRQVDLSNVLRASPLSEPTESLFYPLGLHALLGWSLPDPSGNTIAITAASAVLISAISAPLAVVALARQWRPDSRALWVISGTAMAFAPGVTKSFGIGSVVLIAGAALYPAAVSTLWLWIQAPSLARASACAVGAFGLFSLHVAEAVGLGLVGVASLPLLDGRHLRRIHAKHIAGFVGVLGVVAILTLDTLTKLYGRLSLDWENQPNSESPLTALLIGLVQQPGGVAPIAVLWVGLGLLGFWLAHRRRLRSFPLVMFVVPVLLGAMSHMRGIPSWLNLITAPWYGSAARVGIMAAAPVLLAAGLTLATLLALTAAQRSSRLAGVVAAVCVVALAVQVVPDRRSDLRNELAGAGDSKTVAGTLKGLLREDEAVLNMEGDGTANLFAYARVPVLSGFESDPAITPSKWEQRACSDL